jgi:lipid-A-disaccharide synthase
LQKTFTCIVGLAIPGIKMEKPLRIGVVAGEKSGDNLGAGLMQAILDKHPTCQFEGIGGPAMTALGFNSFFPMDRLSVMGFVEPLGRLPELLRIRKFLKQHFVSHPPDVFIAIDSPDFNLQIEKYLRAQDIKTVHYVSPSVWAYRENRIKLIKQAVDLMLVLFPFETEIYTKHEIPVKFVGHPLAHSIGFEDLKIPIRKQLGLNLNDTVITLMPGSRRSEIKRLCPIFIETAKKLRTSHPDIKFLIPCASQERKDQIELLVQETRSESLVTILDGDAKQAISAADLVLLSSGTATLETMLLKRLMIVCYKLAPLTYMLASRLVTIPHVGLPNLLAGKLLVPEYLQNEVTVPNLVGAVERLLNDTSAREEVLTQFESMHQQMAGDANLIAADAVLRLCER